MTTSATVDLHFRYQSVLSMSLPQHNTIQLTYNFLFTHISILLLINNYPIRLIG